MHAIADTKTLVDEGVITKAAARIIEARARSKMVELAINTILCAGIFFATFGMIFWLADALAVAVSGVLMLGGGLLVLRQGKALYAMFGNAAALIGAGLLLGGAGFELTHSYPDMAGWALTAGGAIIAIASGWAFAGRQLTNRFISGAVMMMAVALHLTGLGFWAQTADVTGLPVHALWVYGAAVIAVSGWFVDVRFISALAIVPFAQALDTSTSYFHAMYAFYSPESTLSILQMTTVIALGLALAQRGNDRLARHARIHVMMAFVVANLCALVGSLWGDVVGAHLWGPGYARDAFADYDAWREAKAAFEASALVIHEDVYSVIWAITLAAIALFAAHKNLRGLFNAAVTFAGIHGYTQMFETFYDTPGAYVIGGLVAIPLAWGMWRLNTRFLEQNARTE